MFRTSLFNILLILLCVYYVQCVSYNYPNYDGAIENNNVKNYNATRVKRDANGENVEKSSLTFVFDTTGSMTDDLNQVKRATLLILDTMITRKNSPISNFVLVPFNDPSVGPITNTTRSERYRSMLNLITVNGGGDCPEMSLTGIIKALEHSLPNSFIYVFTDASAKDFYKINDVFDLIQKKKSQVVFVLTGDCGNTDDIAYKVYEQIARISSGEVFHLDKTDVFKVLEFINATLETNTVNLGYVVVPSGYGIKHKMPIDGSLTHVIASVMGASPQLEIENPEGKRLSGPPYVIDLLSLPNIKVSEITTPEEGEWIIISGSSEEHVLKITGVSDVSFEVGFSVNDEVEDINAILDRPYKNVANYLIVKLHGNKTMKVDSVEILGVTGELQLRLPLHQFLTTTETVLYKTEPFRPPDDAFYTAVTGKDQKKNLIKRITRTAILSQIDEESKKEEDKFVDIVKFPPILQ